MGIEETDADVRNFLDRVSRTGWTGFHKSWPKYLFKLPYREIVEYLLDRRNKTDNPSEYYCILPYLTEDVEDLGITFSSFLQLRNEQNILTNRL